ncbi:MAG: PAS domain S-box protein, partial [Thermoanaerobaculia bacterium]
MPNGELKRITALPAKVRATRVAETPTRGVASAHGQPSNDCWPPMAEAIPHMIWVTRADGTVEYLNRRGAEFLGIEAKDMHGWPWIRLVHPDDVASVRVTWEHALRDTSDYELDYRVRRADATYRWVEARGTPMRTSDGTSVRWLGTWIDVDDCRRAQEELRQAKERTAEALTLLETMQANAPMGFAFVDREFRYVRVNEMLAAINGRSVEEHLGRTVVEVVPDLWPQIGSVYDRVLKTGEPVMNIELSGETPAYPEQVHDWLTSFYPVRLGGEVMGIGVIVLDITERKRAEEFRAVVLDNMLEGLYIVDGDGRLMHMNQSASKMLGWSEGELRGKVMHDAVHYQRADGTPISPDECALQQMRAGRQPARLSGEAFTRRDGSIFPVAYSLAPIRSASGRPGIVVVFRDVTEEATEHAAIQRELATLSWIGRIRDALDENRFVLLAQPIVPLGGGERSVELLLRMVGHDGELVMPGSFLPVAEKYALIGEIDRWVTTEAIRLAGGGL